MARPSYHLISPRDLMDQGLAVLNKQFREHLDEINRLGGWNGPVGIVAPVNVGNNSITAGSLNVGAAQVLTGNVPPNGMVAAPPGSMYLNTKGGKGTTLWVKETGNGKNGWQPK